MSFIKRCTATILAIGISSFAYGVELFPKIATVTESGGKHYNNTVQLWEFSYIQDWNESTDYCHISSIRVSGLNCNSDESYHFSGIQVTNGTEVNNLEQDGRFLSCKVSELENSIYKLTASAQNPQQTTLHTVIVNTKENPSRTIDYSGTKTYISIDNDKLTTEHYIPITSSTSDSDGILHPFSLLPLNCENLLIPSFVD